MIFSPSIPMKFLSLAWSWMLYLIQIYQIYLIVNVTIQSSLYYYPGIDHLLCGPWQLSRDTQSSTVWNSWFPAAEKLLMGNKELF